MSLLQWKFLHPRFWPSWLGLSFLRLSIYLPFKMQLWLGARLGSLLRLFLKRRFHIARRNLEICFPELTQQQRDNLLAENQKNLGILVLETALSWWASDKTLLKRVRFEGLEHLEQAHAKGKGVIILTGHFTSMELCGRLLSLKIPGYVFFRPMKNELFNAVMFAARQRCSEGIILQNNSRLMFKLLRKGKSVWFAPDQDYGRDRSIFVNFFGHIAATVPSTARLAKMTGAAIVPYAPKREQDGSYTLRCYPAIENFPSDDEANDTQRINDILEQEIRKVPEQYFWVHRRFKTQPEGKKSQLYKD